MHVFRLVKSSIKEQLSISYRDVIEAWLHEWSFNSPLSFELAVQDAFECEGALIQDSTVFTINTEGADLPVVFHSKDSNSIHNIIFDGKEAGQVTTDDLHGYILKESISDLFNRLWNELNLYSGNIKCSTFDEQDLHNCFKKGTGTIIVTVETTAGEFYILVPWSKYNTEQDIKKSPDMCEKAPLVCEFDAIPDNNLTVGVVLDSTRISFGELKNLQVNDVLVLEHTVANMVKLKVGKKELVSARLGKIGNKRAILINDK